MNRTPMKRGTGFKRKVYERTRTVHKPIPIEQRRGVVAMVEASPIAQAPKENALSSEAYRRLVAALPCANCRRVGRSQHAHENEGKGKSLKLDDRRAMPLCCDEPGREGCHVQFDQYRLLPGGREAHVAQGRIWAAQTRAEIFARGLWPKRLPLFEETP